MRVSMRWLRELVDVDLAPAALASRLDMTGTAVEAIHHEGVGPEGVVVGRIVTKERHPDADKLWVTHVDIGSDRPLTIVCGADNFEAGDRVPVATVGTMLPGGMTIRKTKLRGIESEGMNCSAPELGVPGDESGLLILPVDAPIGASYAEYRGSADAVLELEVTPNRPDCLSMAGMAREVGAILDRTVRFPGQEPEESGAPAAESVAVRIEDPSSCQRYAARLISGVKVGPSPDWVVERLASAGARPINNIVDITNLVMFEMGQPLHAFDAATLGREDGRVTIIVRSAAPGERLRTLDGQDRELGGGMLAICDPKGPVALAGVMGGEETEVSDATVDVLLESARFEPTSIGRTSRALGLMSEASLRFERGVDAEGCVSAADRAAALMAEIAGGTVAPGIVDEYPVPAQPRSLPLRMSRLNAVLGISVGADEAAAILRRLGLGVAVGADLLDVCVPTFRPDLEREVDLIEEVVRMWGMERVPGTLPAGRGRIGGLTPGQVARERAGAALRAAGLNETMTYAFCDPHDIGALRWDLPREGLLVELVNPMSLEQSVLRPTIVSGLLRSVSYNQRRGVPDVHLYEIGTTFVGEAGREQPLEIERVAGALAGAWHPRAWNDPAAGPNAPSHLDFFDGKGVIETLMEELHVAEWSVGASKREHLQPGRRADVLVAGRTAGWLGEAHPRVLERFEASGPVVLFELDLGALLDAASDADGSAEIPRFPAVELDLAIVVREGTTAQAVSEAITAAAGPLLESARLFDVYRGQGVPEGSRSLAYSLSYRASERTLTDEEVAREHERLVREVCAAVGGELRS